MAGMVSAPQRTHPHSSRTSTIEYEHVRSAFWQGVHELDWLGGYCWSLHVYAETRGSTSGVEISMDRDFGGVVESVSFQYHMGRVSMGTAALQGRMIAG